MQFIDDVKRYVVDLEAPPEKAWAEVIANETGTMRALLDEGWGSAMETTARKSGRSLRFVSGAARTVAIPFHLLYRISRGRYLREIYAWADALGVSRHQCVMMQCLYELSHLKPARPHPGCSAGVVWSEKLGMVHVRTMDWNMNAIGPATRLYDCRRGARRHYVVGLPGFVGALSGMVPGGYSVTINWAPPASHPFFFLGPLFELRHTLETCDTYNEAVRRLTTARLSSSVFFTVCGVKRGEGCVIERVKTGLLSGHVVRQRSMNGDVVAQSNRYRHPDLERFNPRVRPESTMLARTAIERAEILEAGLREIRTAGTMTEMATALDRVPVENAETQQKMSFRPAAGDLLLLRADRGATAT